MSRATRRRLGKREGRRRFEANLKRVLELERENFSPSAISDHLQLEESFVRKVIDDFRSFQADRAGKGRAS
jgi:hypothetical protein